MRGHTLLVDGVVLALLIAAVPAWGQVPDSVHQRNDCRLANQVLTLGQPANRRDWALRVIDGCGELAGGALASLVREHRLVDEPGGELEEVVTRARHVVQPAIFDAATEVALDGAAATVARVQAIRALFTQLFPGSLDPYESFRDDSPVVGGTITEVAMENGPLSRDASVATESRLRGLLIEGGIALPVRNAATRLLRLVVIDLYCGDFLDTPMRSCAEIVKERVPGGG